MGSVFKWGNQLHCLGHHHAPPWFDQKWICPCSYNTSSTTHIPITITIHISPLIPLLNPLLSLPSIIYSTKDNPHPSYPLNLITITHSHVQLITSLTTPPSSLLVHFLLFPHVHEVLCAWPPSSHHLSDLHTYWNHHRTHFSILHTHQTHHHALYL